VVIINNGRVVAVDTPDNLIARLKGAETMYVQVDAEGADVVPVLSSIPGVLGVAASEQRGLVGAFEVESDRGNDIRRELARTIVNRGWGLLELRPMRMSLEEVFLQVTTEERPEGAPGQVIETAPAPGDSVGTEGAAND
jgi:ABC-2 type transport system ATP-binding protein